MHILRQTADVVMRLDRLRRRRAALDNIRIQRPLRQEIEIVELRRFLLEHVDEFVADDLALLLRIFDAAQLAQETLARIDLDHLHIELADERFHDALRFAFAQQAMVDEHASQLVADRLVQQHRHDRGIHAAAQRTQHLAVADLRADLANRILDERCHLQLPSQPQMLNRKLRIISLPYTECRTSGWNWTAYIFLLRMAHRRDRRMLACCASTRNPSGSSATWSPWLIQTCLPRSMPCSVGCARMKSTSALPYSRLPARSTLPFS